MNNIKVSFIVPVYNVEKYLKDCIESIINQKINKKEILLINDGSIDKSGEICKEYSEKFNFIKVINKKNTGLSSTRNLGIDNAKGEYIFFIDSDDFLLGNYILDIYNECIKNNLDIIRCIYTRYDDDKKEIVTRKVNKKTYYNKVLTGINFLEEEINSNEYEVVACLGLFKRKYLLKNNLKFTENVTHEDHEFFLKCLLNEKNNRIMKKNIIIYAYRCRLGSITQTPKLENIKDILINIKYMITYIESLKLSKKEKRIAMIPVSSIFYQLTSIYGRLTIENRNLAYKMIPNYIKNDMIRYSFNKHQKIKIIMFFYLKSFVDFIYKIKFSKSYKNARKRKINRNIEVYNSEN